MTKWTQLGAILCLIAISATSEAATQQSQGAANTADSDKRGNEVLLEAAKAAGGEKLSSVSTLAIDESGKVMTPQGDTSLAVKWMVAYPDRSHGEVNYGGQSVIQVC